MTGNEKLVNSRPLAGTEPSRHQAQGVGRATMCILATLVVCLSVL